MKIVINNNEKLNEKLFNNKRNKQAYHIEEKIDYHSLYRCIIPFFFYIYLNFIQRF